MPATARRSRLSFRYLALRHAGVVFFCLALGCLAGVLRQALSTPREYLGRARGGVRAVSDLHADPSFWENRERGWTALFSGRAGQALLGMNLRYAVKRAVAAALKTDDLPPEWLRRELSSFKTPGTFSTAPAENWPWPYLDPSVTLARHEIVPGMDFQSLARVAADMEPPAGMEKDWTFPDVEADPGEWIVAFPGPDDYFFRVFHRLYALLHGGRQPATPADAWRAAVEEVRDRLARESEAEGAGGFGPGALRELALELASLRILVANGLQPAGNWVYGGMEKPSPAAARAEDLWKDRWSGSLSLTLSPEEDGRKEAEISLRFGLHPASFPMDSPQTRIHSLAARVAWRFLRAREIPPRADAADAAPEAGPPAPPELPDLKPAAEPPRPAAVPPPLSSRLPGLRDRLRAAETARDQAARRLKEGEAEIENAGRELREARDRADRLRERLEAHIAEPPPPVPEPEDSEELVHCKAERLARVEYVNRMLATSTEAHPFIIRAREEIAALDGMIAELEAKKPEPGPDAPRDARALGLQTALEAEESKILALEERHKRLSVALSALGASLAGAEQAVAAAASALEGALDGEKAAERKPVEVLNTQLNRLNATLGEMAVAPRAPIVVQVPEPERQTVSEPPALDFQGPLELRLETIPASPLPVYAAVLAGLLAGLLISLVREFSARRFDGARDASRLFDMPVLAALPAYAPKSFEAAAKALGGAVERDRFGLTFIPAAGEAPPLEKRRAVTEAPRKKRLLSWCLGLAAAIASAFVFLASDPRRQPVEKTFPASAWEMESGAVPAAKPVQPGELAEPEREAKP